MKKELLNGLVYSEKEDENGIWEVILDDNILCEENHNELLNKIHKDIKSLLSKIGFNLDKIEGEIILSNELIIHYENSVIDNYQIEFLNLDLYGTFEETFQNP